MKKAIYAFSGDPITYGHIDIIKRATRVFTQVIIGIGANPNKKYMFTLEQRTEMAKKSLKNIPNVRVISFKGLLVDYAFEHGIPVIIKGVRNIRDFDYEVMLHQLSESQKLNIDTYLLPAKQDLSHISSSASKALQQEQGLIHEYVPLYVKMCLEGKMSGQYIIGITGEIGAGKSYISSKIEELGHANGIPVHNIELDHIGHQILGGLKEPIYENVREDIEKKFGKGVRCSDGKINRKVLGEIVFNNKEKLNELNTLLYKPLMVRLRRELYMKKGLILLNAALIAESNLAYICNNNILLVTVDKKSQKRRLKERDLTPLQIKKRLDSQFNEDQKKEILLAQIKKKSCGWLWEIDNSDNSDEALLYERFMEIISTVDIYGELRFRMLWKRLGAHETYLNEYNRIILAYAEPQRSYHTFSHISHGLKLLKEVKKDLNYPDETECAWWYHDIVYRPESQKNEEDSAENARKALTAASVDENAVKRICELIMDTKHPARPALNESRYLIDIDLSVLGQSYSEVLVYEQKIRQEYSVLPDQRYREGRREFLSKLLNLPSIYHTDYFKNKFEKTARENLTRIYNELG